MTAEQIIEFHSGRAMAELDKAYEASCQAAANAHFRLSMLHLERMRDERRRSFA